MANDETAAVCARGREALTETRTDATGEIVEMYAADLRHLLRCAEAFEWMASGRFHALFHVAELESRTGKPWEAQAFGPDGMLEVYAETPLAAVLSALDASREGK